MKIRTRITLLSTLVFGVVFLLMAVLVHVLFIKSSERLIYDEMARNCNLAAYFYLEKDELPAHSYEKVVQSYQRTLLNHQVRIFDEQNEIRYGKSKPDAYITNTLLSRIRKQGTHAFRQDSLYYYGVYYPDNEGDFVVVLRENNTLFHNQANRLLGILAGLFVLGLTSIWLLSRALAKLAYKPISRVIAQVQQLDSDSLEQPIPSLHTQDEIQQLIDTYNSLLRRLSETFVLQKNFINYVSHELKTPLAAISGNLEVFAQRARTPEERQQVVTTVVEQVHHIEQMLTALVKLAGLRGQQGEATPVRVDELLWNLLEINAHRYQGTPIHISQQVPAAQEQLLTVTANATQLQMAIGNVLDNAVKYADGKPVTLSLAVDDNQLRLIIADQGVGIPQEELSHISKPFFRGSNVHHIQGSGVGLSVAGIVLKKNGVDLRIASTQGAGTRVGLHFPPQSV